MNAMPPPAGTTVSELLQVAARLFRASLLKCLPLGMLAALCAQLANYYWRATGHALELAKPPDDAAYDVLSILGLIGWLWLLSALMLRQRALIGGWLPATAALAAAGRRLPSVFGAGFLGGVVLAIGFAPAWIASGLLSGAVRTWVVLLLALPNLFLLVCLSLLLPITLFDQRSPYRAVMRAFELVRPVWTKVCAALVIGMLIVLVCALVAAAGINLLQVLAGDGPASQAVANALLLATQAIAAVFFSALCLVLYSMASSSA